LSYTRVRDIGALRASGEGCLDTPAASYTGAGALPRLTARPSPHAARRCGGKGDPDPRDEPVDHPTGRRRRGVGACVDGRDGEL